MGYTQRPLPPVVGLGSFGVSGTWVVGRGYFEPVEPVVHTWPVGWACFGCMQGVGTWVRFADFGSK